jgi:hypothetical protein
MVSYAHVLGVSEQMGGGSGKFGIGRLLVLVVVGEDDDDMVVVVKNDDEILRLLYCCRCRLVVVVVVVVVGMMMRKALFGVPAAALACLSPNVVNSTTRNSAR